MRKSFLVILCFCSMFFSTTCNFIRVEPTITIEKRVPPETGLYPQNPPGPAGQYVV